MLADISENVPPLLLTNGESHFDLFRDPQIPKRKRRKVLKNVQFDNMDWGGADEQDEDFDGESDEDFDPEAMGTDSDNTRSPSMSDLDESAHREGEYALESRLGSKKKGVEPNSKTQNLYDNPIVVHVDKDDRIFPEATTDESNVSSDGDSSSEESDTSDESGNDDSDTSKERDSDDSDSSKGTDSDEEDGDSSSDEDLSDSDSSDSSSGSKTKGSAKTADTGSKSRSTHSSTRTSDNNRLLMEKSSKTPAKTFLYDIETAAETPKIHLDRNVQSFTSHVALEESRNRKSSETEIGILVPPGEGKPETKKRNERRKLKKKLEKLQQEHLLGDIPNSVFENQNSHSDSPQTNGINRNANGTVNDVSHKANISKDFDLEERRRQLLQSLESGGTELDTAKEDESVTSPGTVMPLKRMKLDVASSRRLLFGSLGLRNPKTKEEELKLSQKLMSRSQRPPIISNAVESNSSPTNEAANIANGQLSSNGEVGPLDENWRLRIKLSAVECVDENVVLSEPPYPFLQRWDSQYQNWNRGRKRMKYSNEALGNSIDSSMVDKEIQLMVELPELPTEPETLPDAMPTDITHGTIIAFKQVECDASTNWRPTVSQYRVARVEEVVDNSTYHLVLAQRDLMRTAPKYDESGNRVFGRFEMPEEDESEALTDDGARMMNYSDMMTPKIVMVAA